MARTSNIKSLFITAEYLKVLVEVIKGYPVDVDAMLREAGIPKDLLVDDASRVPFEYFHRFVLLALEKTNDRMLSLQFGPKLTLQTHGFLGYAAMSSSTAGDALELAMKYFKTRTNIFDFSVRLENEMVVIQIDEALPLGEVLPFAVESIFASFTAMGAALLGEEALEGSEARVTYSAPEHISMYQALSENLIYFDCAANQMRFPKNNLEKPIKFADPNLARLAEEQCKVQLADIDHRAGLLGQVRRILLADIRHNSKLDIVSEHMCMSSRTLKRKLATIGTGFQEVLDHVRRGLAVEYLAQTDKSIDEIAMLIGYSDPSNFGRAFRKWTGVSPKVYRDREKMRLQAPSGPTGEAAKLRVVGARAEDLDVIS